MFCMFVKCVQMRWRSCVGKQCSGSVKAGQAETGQIEQLFEENVWLWCLVGFGNA